MNQKKDLPTYSDEEFDRKARDLWKGYDQLYEETLRNPSYSKVRRLAHDMMTLVDSLTKPVNNSDEVNTNLYYQFEDNRLGTQETRAERNQHLREYASSRYMWPCVVEVHKGLSDMTFPRSEKNDSGLEVFLDHLNLGKNLPGKQTARNKNRGTSFRDKDGKHTFSGLILNEIETINLRLNDFRRRRQAGELVVINEDYPWMKPAIKLAPLDNTNIIEWTEIILQKNYGDCSYELTSLLLKSFNSVQKSKGGKTYEEGANMGSYIKRRIQEELKKILP